jgi:hypothetical protein
MILQRMCLVWIIKINQMLECIRCPTKLSMAFGNRKFLSFIVSVKFDGHCYSLEFDEDLPMTLFQTILRMGKIGQFCVLDQLTTCRGPKF